MKSFNLLISCLLFLSTSLSAQMFQKKVTVRATPADATISEVVAGSKDLKQLGIGTAVVIVPKNGSITIVLQKAGFADLKKVYSSMTDEKLPKEDLLTMKDRTVTLKVLPTDAKIFLNGNELEKGSMIVTVKSGEQANVEVKKPGFVSVKKSYSNQSDSDGPPEKDEIKLRDRMIQVVTTPSDAKLIVDNQMFGAGNGDIIVPLDRCVVVKIIKDGYLELEQTYCNKEGGAELPVKESFTLQDRLVLVRTTPEDVSIKVNGRYVAKGEYDVKILKGECVNVTMEKEGAVTIQKSYCNQDNAPVIPVIDRVDLMADATYALSAASDSLNINNIIDINPNLSDADAWKAMSQVVMSAFDIIEVTDKATGYLRTAWAVKSFPNNTIRTRIIVKVADSNKLKFAVKLCSETSGKNGTGANDDGSYSEWSRVLLPYKHVLSTIQLRLK